MASLGQVWVAYVAAAAFVVGLGALGLVGLGTVRSARSLIRSIGGLGEQAAGIVEMESSRRRKAM